MNENDLEEFEEEIYVLAQFNDLPEHENFQLDENTYFKIIGIETEEPIVQFRNDVYKGKYETCMGTYLFFEADPNPPESDPVFDPHLQNPLRFSCKTRKVLNLEKVFLKPVDGKDEKENDVTCKEESNIDDENIPKSASMVEALNQLQAYLVQFPEMTSKDNKKMLKLPRK